MGGDYGLESVIPACLSAIRKHSDLKLILVGDEDRINTFLRKYKASVSEQLSIHHAAESVAMDELPSHALRNKKDSSMRVAIDLVKKEIANACVSAGNTGALMATARYVLKTLPGIDRPAIVSELPTIKGKTWVIDLGANVDSCAEHLFQFAVMGSALVKALTQKSAPKIALLNIGVEEIKGNDQVKRTAHMLEQCDLMNYIGYVEGNHFYTGEVDLVVCDGFVGNVALKASEGIAKMFLQLIKESFQHNFWTKLVGFITYPILKKIKERLDPSRYNGASLLGLNGIVVKSHGGANALGFQHAIEQAMLEVKNDVIDSIREQTNEFMNQGLFL